MKSAQVLRGLFKDPGRQVLLIRPGCVIFDSVHVVFGCHLFLKFSKIGISEILSFLVVRRIEAEQENDQAEDGRDYAHGLFTRENRWSDDPEQDAKQRTRYGEPEGNVPAPVLSC